MLRQANDHLERTMTEKQTLEDSVKVGNEETAAKVWTQGMRSKNTGKYMHDDDDDDDDYDDDHC